MNKPVALGCCPVCGARLTLSGNLLVGELLECDVCEIELEVTGLGPVELKKIQDDEQQWEE